MNIKSMALIAIPMLIAATTAFAQTNAVVTGITVNNASEASYALLHYLGVNKQNIAVIALVVHVAAKYIRNYGFKFVTQDQANFIHKIIALLAANPLPATIK